MPDHFSEITSFKIDTNFIVDKYELFPSTNYQRKRRYKLSLPSSITEKTFYSNPYASEIREASNITVDTVFAVHVQGNFKFCRRNRIDFKNINNHMHGEQLLISSNFENSSFNPGCPIAIPYPYRVGVYPWTMYSNFLYPLIKLVSSLPKKLSTCQIIIICPSNLPQNIKKILQMISSNNIKLIEIREGELSENYSGFIFFDGLLEIVDQRIHLNSISYLEKLL